MKVEALDALGIITSSGATHAAIIAAADLTEATANTAQSIKIATAPAYSVVEVVAVTSKGGLKDASDAAFNTTALEVGTAADSDALLASQELNSNAAAKVLAKTGVGPVAFASETDIFAKFAAMAAKSLKDIDNGEVYIFLKIAQTAQFNS